MQWKSQLRKEVWYVLQRWIELKQVTETLEKAKKEADKLIEKAKSTALSDRKPVTETLPTAEHEETAA